MDFMNLSFSPVGARNIFFISQQITNHTWKIYIYIYLSTCRHVARRNVIFTYRVYRVPAKFRSAGRDEEGEGRMHAL